MASFQYFSSKRYHPSQVIRVQETNGQFVLLGQGLFGKIFSGQLKQAENSSLQPVALKFIHSEYDFDEEEIWHELYTMNLFNHQNISKVFGYYKEQEEPNSIALVMELIEPPLASPNQSSSAMQATNLADFLFKSKDSKFDDLQFKLHLMMQATKALQHIHSKRIVHRNLKSKNFLLNPQFELRLSGFGLGSLLDLQKELLGMNHQQRFRAPELLSTPPIYSFSSDIYDLGMIFFEILERREPYDSKIAEAVGELYWKYGKPEFSKNQYPEQLVELIQSMWRHNRKQRPTAQQVLWKLEEICSSLSSRG